jgi:hypothetical protein
MQSRRKFIKNTGILSAGLLAVQSKFPNEGFCQ